MNARIPRRKAFAMKRFGLPIAAVLAAALAAGCGERNTDSAQAENAPEKISIGASDVATAVRTTLHAGVPVSGSLEPKVFITVGAPVAEQIVEMFVDEGQPVQQGEPLCRFKDDVLRAVANSARADVATQRMQANIAVAESTRADALLREGAIAPRDRDNAVLALNAARARLALAEAQAASADDGLSTATLRAPASGVVSRRYLQAGDRVDFGKPVFDIVDTRVLQLSASVPVEHMAELRIGRPVSLTVSQLDSTSVTGRISRINPTADNATRQVRIYVDIPNHARRLVGGLFVSGRVLTQEAPNAIAVPRTALRYEGDARTPMLYVIVQGKVARRTVGVGILDEERQLVQVTSGVQAGDIVVVGPIEGLTEGAPVEILGQAADSTARRAR
ncbi:MAG: efflux RND transporter periplasmic adaptor subunit [Gemmatimonadota bacterium]